MAMLMRRRRDRQFPSNILLGTQPMAAISA
jgi:hypothetical protein